ncbi:MAG: RNA 2',3'-cyclic phosphodiesterase [Dethiobacteria bacterium]|jgi:2'-5' RNA ligase
MRSFLAINLSQQLKKELGCLQEKLKQKGVKEFKWVNPELMHITLKFLGNITSRQVSLLEKPLQELGNRTASFNLSLAGLGAFPHKKRPRVLWGGIKRGAAEIINLSMEIEEITKQLGFPPGQRKVVPHLTIGRQKNSAFDFPPGVFEQKWESKTTLFIDRFSLIKSTLYPSGPEYTTLKDFLLK